MVVELVVIRGKAPGPGGTHTFDPRQDKEVEEEVHQHGCHQQSPEGYPWAQGLGGDGERKVARQHALLTVPRELSSRSPLNQMRTTSHHPGYASDPSMTRRHQSHDVSDPRAHVARNYSRDIREPCRHLEPSCAGRHRLTLINQQPRPTTPPGKVTSPRAHNGTYVRR